MLPSSLSQSAQELFSTKKGEIHQCDLTNRIYVRFEELSTSFRILEFLNFRRSINHIDIRSKIFDLSDECDFEYIEGPRKSFNKQFTLCEVIQLRELINGAHFTIELNSMLHDALCPERIASR